MPPLSLHSLVTLPSWAGLALVGSGLVVLALGRLGWRALAPLLAGASGGLAGWLLAPVTGLKAAQSAALGGGVLGAAAALFPPFGAAAPLTVVGAALGRALGLGFDFDPTLGLLVGAIAGLGLGFINAEDAPHYAPAFVGVALLSAGAPAAFGDGIAAALGAHPLWLGGAAAVLLVPALAFQHGRRAAAKAKAAARRTDDERAAKAAAEEERRKRFLTATGSGYADRKR